MTNESELIWHSTFRHSPTVPQETVMIRELDCLYDAFVTCYVLYATASSRRVSTATKNETIPYDLIFNHHFWLWENIKTP